MIGHADIGMTDRYSHLTAQHKLLMQRQLTNPHACQGAGTLTLTKHTNDFDTDTDTAWEWLPNRILITINE
jgi:hypothetical protein